MRRPRSWSSLRPRLAAVSVLAFAALLVVAGCDNAAPVASAGSPSINPNAGIVRVGAAFSLSQAFTAAKDPFEAATPGSRLTFTFGATDALVGQVQRGGFDAFASEDLGSAQAVVAARHGAGPAQVFALDPIVLIVPTPNKAAIATPADLARSGVRIASTDAGSPLAAATTQLIAELGGQARAPAGYASAVAANTRAVGPDPRAVVSAVEQGDADAAFVYASDMIASTSVTKVPLAAPVDTGAVGRFAIVVIAEAGDPVAASAFARWLTSDDGQKALAPYGFEAPGS